MVVEAVYSMRGDFGALREVLDVAVVRGASVFIDEAHSMLACGVAGSCCGSGVEDRFPLVYGMF